MVWPGEDERPVIRAILAGLLFAAPSCVVLFVWPI